MNEEEFKERLRLFEHARAGLDASGRSIAETYDRALLTLSSAFLGGSLAFIGQVVADLARSTAKGLLYAAWLCFALTIVLTLFSFVYGLLTLEPLRVAAERFYMHKETDARNKSIEVQRWVLRFSVAQGVSFALGIVLLGVFIAVNIRENNVPQKVGSGNGKVQENSIPPGSFQTPMTPATSQEGGAGQQQPAPQPSKQGGDKSSGK